MQRFRSVIVCAALAALTSTVLAAPARQDVGMLSRDEVVALQKRLADAGCYRGPRDGAVSDVLRQAVGECPDQRPVLTIETGMHTAPIKRIGVDRACRLLATGSDDKTVRLWSLPEGRLLRTLRWPVGAGDGGKVYAVALSPDGALVAAGGWDARWATEKTMSVYLFDAASGALKARIGAFEQVINHLAFSPDGRWLAATLGHGKGVRLIDAGRMAEAAADRDYGDQSYGAVFGLDGRLYTVAYDGLLRAYGPGLRLERKVRTTGGARPLSVALDPSGERLAVGFNDNTRVEVYRGSDLSRLFAADNVGIENGSLGSVSWSEDGRRLAAAGRHSVRGVDGRWTSPVVLWDNGGRGTRRVQPVADNTVSHVLPCGGGLALGASDPLWALLGPDGRARVSRSGVTADMRGVIGDGFQASRDGRAVRFGLGHGTATPVLFDLAGARLDERGSAEGLEPPRTTGVPVMDWKDSVAPKLAGRPIPLDQYETSRSLAVAPDGRSFVLGTGWALRGFDAEFGGLGIEVTMADGLVKVVRPVDGGPAAAAGVRADDLITHLDGVSVQGLTLNEAVQRMRGPANSKVRLTVARHGSGKPFDVAVTRNTVPSRQQWQRDVPGTAWGVNLTGDGRLVVAAYGDGTVRWHRASDGQELLALFVHRADRRWVAWTPTGYYMASPGGEDLIGWHLNRGWDQAADFFPASRFRERFARPDIVQKVLDTLDEGQAVEEANRVANMRTDTTSVASRLPPVVRIVSPVDGTVVSGREVTVEYELRSPSGLPVDTVEVQLDGRPSRGLQRVEPDLGSGTRVERQMVSIPAQDVTLGLVARSGTLASEVATVRLKWAGVAPSGEEALKPKLYGVIVGVSIYRDASLNLQFAAKDAQDFAAALMAQKGGLYRDVELRVLTDAQATTAELKRALTWLERAVTSRDVGVVFLAGHGQQDAKNRYYYLTADSVPGEIEDTALDGVTLKERTRSVAGKVFVFLDTCYAGKAMVSGARGAVDINRFVNELSSTENGVVTYASSTGREVSQEDARWGNGAFTRALMEGLGRIGGKARADVTGRGVITTAALDLWLSERVKELTGGAQHPVMIRPPNVPDFPMFVVGK
jgi:hypothetical protein